MTRNSTQNRPFSPLFDIHRRYHRLIPSRLNSRFKLQAKHTSSNPLVCRADRAASDSEIHRILEHVPLVFSKIVQRGVIRMLTVGDVHEIQIEQVASASLRELVTSFTCS